MRIERRREGRSEWGGGGRKERGIEREREKRENAKFNVMIDERKHEKRRINILTRSKKNRTRNVKQINRNP